MVSFKLLRFPAFFKAFYTPSPTEACPSSDNQSDMSLHQFRHTAREEGIDWQEEKEDFENPEMKRGGSDEDEEISCMCWHCGTRIKGRRVAGPFLF